MDNSEIRSADILASHVETEAAFVNHPGRVPMFTREGVEQEVIGNADTRHAALLWLKAWHPFSPLVVERCA